MIGRSTPIELVEGLQIFHDLREQNTRRPFKSESNGWRDQPDIQPYEIPSTKFILDGYESRPHTRDDADSASGYAHWLQPTIEDSPHWKLYLEQCETRGLDPVYSDSGRAGLGVTKARRA